MLPADATDLLWLRSLPVLSQWNLSAFLHWAQSAEEPLLIDVLGRISLPEHRCDFGGPSRPITIRGHVLSPSPCTEINCIRCTRGAGGYQFRWISPLWTAKAFIDYENEGPRVMLTRIQQGASPATLPLIDRCPTDAEMNAWAQRFEATSRTTS